MTGTHLFLASSATHYNVKHKKNSNQRGHDLRLVTGIYCVRNHHVLTARGTSNVKKPVPRAATLLDLYPLVCPDVCMMMRMRLTGHFAHHTLYNKRDISDVCVSFFQPTYFFPGFALFSCSLRVSCPPCTCWIGPTTTTTTVVRCRCCWLYKGDERAFGAFEDVVLVRLSTKQSICCC